MSVFDPSDSSSGLTPLQTAPGAPLEANAARWIMRSLGYALQRTPNGGKAYTRTAVHRDEQTVACVCHEDRHNLPLHLDDPVWVGHYSDDDSFEMLFDEAFPSLLEFLRQAHETRELAPLSLDDAAQPTTTRIPGKQRS